MHSNEKRLRQNQQLNWPKMQTNLDWQVVKFGGFWASMSAFSVLPTGDKKFAISNLSFDISFLLLFTY